MSDFCANENYTESIQQNLPIILRRAEGVPQETESKRSKILRLFEQRLDEILSEEPPEGITEEIYRKLEEMNETSDSDEHEDMYSLWSALTALTQETKLRGRVFSDLRQEIEPMGGFVESTALLLEKLQNFLESNQRQNEESLRRQVMENTADLLIDIRERLLRGLDAARKSLTDYQTADSQSLFNKFFRKSSKKRFETIKALIDGYELTMTAVETAMKRHGISQMDCQGRPFNPSFMKAVDVEESDHVDDGTVLDVYRRGYMVYDNVYRQAEVRVARNSRQRIFEQD